MQNDDTPDFALDIAVWLIVAAGFLAALGWLGSLPGLGAG